MILRLWPVVLALGLIVSPLRAQPNEIRKSVARINNTMQEGNYRVPWLPGQLGGGSGTGWVVSADRILTNAHVVSNARFLTVEKEDDPKKYIATVEHIAHDCDLAILKVQDPAFFKNTKPLALGGIPELESTVSVFGYPIGGERLSVTQGVVSRIDFRTYTHSVLDSHLTIQIDAAINPGNSGGPVLQEGNVVGVAFQGFSGDVAQNVGYMIPTPVIRHFLKDIEDGHYDRYMDLSIGIANTQNPAMRKGLGLGDDDRGVMVSSVQSAGVCGGKLEVGDVLLSIDGHDIASDGMVELEGERVLMSEVAERKFLGDSVKLGVLRNKKPLDVTIKFDHAWPYLMQANAYDTQPTYILFGGLLFQPLSRNLLGAYRFQNDRISYFYDNFVTKEIYKEHPEVIVLSEILPDPINTYLSEFHDGIVDEINDHKIRTLKDAADAFAEKPEFYVIKFIGYARPLVLERSAVEAARERIRKRYNVLAEQNLSETEATSASR
ncbi:2-alkenal reductase [Chthoniobacter flavus Ellin428]|uniref:2-alkenal reductase n=1 Tax=Chthoniobacter flavus Ellin428 TaxID=497964 RepID=B4CVQ0_9BACT|nr:S1C family serine protease [Chthoniobacter flavus]EDY21492.1 2-alkenal reductase [Chthoniobacter flavus Ellin428]TCO95443.1 S1-C subfamily serine protease [Chthoniobacter flavus]